MGQLPAELRQGLSSSSLADFSRRGDGVQAVPPAPWQMRQRDAMTGGLPGNLLSQMAGEEVLSGIERRLPRRAELLWNRLRAESDLPPARAAGALLAAPFSTQALLVTKPVRGRPQIAFAGADIGGLGPVGIGPAVADSKATAPVPNRLAALGLAAIAARRPQHLDSDFDPDLGANRSAVLFRAVALPLEADAGSGLSGLAVVVLSWRKLLSAQETDALHAELQAAVSWLGSAQAAGTEH
jgi:hypothetical protein